MLLNLRLECVFVILLVVFFCDVTAKELNLVILHNNDMHSRFEEVSTSTETCQPQDIGKHCIGGFARTAHEVRRFRKLADEGKGPKVLFLNAGDTYVGTSWYTVYRDQICADFMNIIKPDAMCLGNHEFDEGMAGLVPFIEATQFPILTCNVDFSQVPMTKPVNKSIILNIDGVQVGIIGYTISDITYNSKADFVTVSEELESVISESERLDKMGIKIIIALGHSGHDVDMEIAAKAPLVDLIVGGHSNTFLWNGPQLYAEKPDGPYPYVVTQPSGKKVPIVQAYAHTKYLGVLNVTFNDLGDLVAYAGQPEYMGTEIPQDQDVLDLLEKYRPKIDELARQVVGQSRVYLDGFFDHCRKRECNFGNLVTDAFVIYAAKNNENRSVWTSDAPIGLYNAGNFRNSINITQTGGNVTKSELLGALPYFNDLYTFSLKGSDVILMLETSIRNAGKVVSGEFLQVSGLHVVFDPHKPSGHRVVSVKVRCQDCIVPKYEDLKPNSVYRMITTDFLLNGGDGFSILKAKAFNKKMLDEKVPGVIEWYIRLRSPLYPELEGRIQFLSGAPNSGNSLKISSLGSVFLLFVIAKYFL